MSNYVLNKFKKQLYIIPLFQVGGAAFTNNTAINDVVEVVSANTGDTTQKITIWGTTNGKTDLVYETVTINGTTAVGTSKNNWGTIYGVFLGDSKGKNSVLTAGNITIRKKTGAAGITSITAGNRSIGTQIFDVKGLDVTISNFAGNTWINTISIPTVSNSKKLVNAASIDICVNTLYYLYFLGDTTGSTVDVLVYDE